MADDAFKSNQEEEYHASDTETSTSSVFSATSSAEKPHILERLKRKNIFTVIGIIIGIFVVYKMIDILFLSKEGHKTNITVSRPVTPPSVVTTPQQRVTTETMPPISIAETTAQVNKLEQQTASIDKINFQMTEIQSALSTMGNRLDEMNGALQALATQVAQQQAILTAEKEKKEKSRIKAKQKTKPKPIYFVRALVPGRAWLAASDGETITVGLGDNLPGYGVIQVIDANQGTITTNTGAIIGYSPNER